MKCCIIAKNETWKKLSSFISRKVAFLNSTCFALWPARKACTICNLYGRMTKPRFNSRHTVDWEMPSSWLAQRMDLRGLREKISWTFKTASSEILGQPGLFLLHKQTVSSNRFVPTTNDLALGATMPKLRWNACCTEITDLAFAKVQNTKVFAARLSLCAQ